MIRFTPTHLEIDLDRLRGLGEAVAGIAILALLGLTLVFFFRTATLKPNPQSSDIESISKNQEVVLEHTNRHDQSGNTIVVYCDLPSYDRIYVLNGSTMYVEKGGCANLP